MTLIDQIEDVWRESPHPLREVLPSLRGMTIARRVGTSYRPWIRSREAAESAEVLDEGRIGINLFDYARGLSHGACIDIDAGNHGLTVEQAREVEARRPDYVTCSVSSTNGTGRHWYVLWSQPVACNEAQHRLMGKQMGAQVQTDVDLPYQVVDVSINVLWVMATDRAPTGLIGECWPDRRYDPASLPQLPTLPGKQGDVPAEISEADKRLMALAKGTKYVCDWVADIGAIRTHKGLLAELQLHYPGRFHTDSACTDPATPNCWLRRNEGHWDVYCWGGDETWPESSGGFRTTTYGKALTLKQVGGVPESDNSIVFDDPDAAVVAVREMTGETITIPDSLRANKRQWTVSRKGIVVRLQTPKVGPSETVPSSWGSTKSAIWTGVKPFEYAEPSERRDSDIVRRQFYQTRQNGRLTGLYRYDGEASAVLHTPQQARSAARALLGGDDPTFLLDQVVERPVDLLCEAFQPVLQKGALNIGPQWIVTPKPGDCPTWLMMLSRLGASLDEVLASNEWAIANGVTTGGAFLECWCGWMCQDPRQRVPALGFVGPTRCGKSSLGDALETLMTESGTTDVGELLRKGSQFTAGLATSVLARVEELDCSSRSSRDRIASWVTGPSLWGEAKGSMPFRAPNQTRIIITTNSATHLPVFHGDCRLVVCEVAPLPPEKRDHTLPEKLAAEAPAFLHRMLSMELPPRYDRLALPPLETDAKADLEDVNRNDAERFATEMLNVTGSDDDFIANTDLFGAYREWCQTNGQGLSCESPASLVRGLSEWFSLSGARAVARNRGRGRLGISLKA